MEPVDGVRAAVKLPVMFGVAVRQPEMNGAASGRLVKNGVAKRLLAVGGGGLEVKNPLCGSRHRPVPLIPRDAVCAPWPPEHRWQIELLRGSYRIRVALRKRILCSSVSGGRYDALPL